MLAESIKKKYPTLGDRTISIISSGFDYAVDWANENDLRNFDDVEILKIVNKAKEWIMENHPEAKKPSDVVFEDIELALDNTRYMTLDGDSFFDWLLN